jgi:hypothetical protein
MKNRPASSLSIHDRVIQVVAAAQTSHDTYQNPNQQKNVSVKIDGQDVYPDLVLCKPGTMTVAHLIEVETAESVTDAEAEQWGQYARGPGQFWLLVPGERLATAQAICRRKGIAGGFGQWWSGTQGITFEWLQAVVASH